MSIWGSAMNVQPSNASTNTGPIQSWHNIFPTVQTSKFTECSSANPSSPRARNRIKKSEATSPQGQILPTKLKH
eukprot:2957882-Amphidinium_carterae.1